MGRKMPAVPAMHHILSDKCNIQLQNAPCRISRLQMRGNKGGRPDQRSPATDFHRLLELPPIEKTSFPTNFVPLFISDRLLANQERWQSGRMRRSRKPLYRLRYRGFESLPLRQYITLSLSKSYNYFTFIIILLSLHLTS